jgi:hypothetical protein
MAKKRKKRKKRVEEYQPSHPDDIVLLVVIHEPRITK